jgi:hypothetical protein
MSVPCRSFLKSATPPPISAAISTAASPVPQPTPLATSTTLASATSQQESTWSAAQHRFCLSTLRILKKMKDAHPFLRPVDIVALNIPHYPSIIKTPMDFSTIDRKLVASHPIKPDPNEDTLRYYNADEFIADVRLIFQNTATFNGPDHVVTAMGKRVQEAFDKHLKNLPPPNVCLFDIFGVRLLICLPICFLETESPCYQEGGDACFRPSSGPGSGRR